MTMKQIDHTKFDRRDLDARERGAKRPTALCKPDGTSKAAPVRQPYFERMLENG
jgi:hypothetical protein